MIRNNHSRLEAALEVINSTVGGDVDRFVRHGRFKCLWFQQTVSLSAPSDARFGLMAGRTHSASDT